MFKMFNKNHKTNKKGQLGLGQAPQVVLLVGLVFLMMATMAFVASKYGTAVAEDTSATRLNEVVTQAELAANAYLDGSNAPGATNFAVTGVTNTSGYSINSGNWSVGSDGRFRNLTSTFSSSNWNVNYTYDWSSNVAFNVTEDLQTEIDNNTSIAGIVLTISLVGIVLSILVSVFLVTRRGTGRA